MRNFSYEGNKNQIGVYNLNNGLYIRQAKLKTQGSKNFFYGYDGIIEENLAGVEGFLSQGIKEIINNRTVPKRGTSEHLELLTFASLTDLRNPVRIENMKSMLKEMEKRLLEVDPNVDTKKFIPPLTHDEIIRMSLANVPEAIQNTYDLDCKLLLNGTNRPFISSDFPVVKYNQFLELKKWPHSKIGYGTVGLQIFIPVTSKIALIFYDSWIYKVGNKKGDTFTVTKNQDVDEINKLQFINCLETIFFDESASEDYIRQLHQNSKKHNRANVAKSELSYIFSGEEDTQQIIDSGQKNLMILGTSGCETNLRIEGLKIHAKGKIHKLNKSVAQVRPSLEKIEQKIKTAANNKK